MKRIVALISLYACAALAQTKSTNGLKLWSDGAALAIHTESSRANSPLSTSGSIVVGKGASLRLVLDRNSNPVFAYDIEIRKTAQGTVTLRINPIDQQKV